MVCALTLTAGHAQKKLPYRDATLPIEERVNDLLSRMTTEEKVGQLRCTLAWDYYETDGKKVVPSEKFKKDIAEGQIGMLFRNTCLSTPVWAFPSSWPRKPPMATWPSAPRCFPPVSAWPPHGIRS